MNDGGTCVFMCHPKKQAFAALWSVLIESLHPTRYECINAVMQGIIMYILILNFLH